MKFKKNDIILIKNFQGVFDYYTHVGFWSGDNVLSSQETTEVLILSDSEIEELLEKELAEHYIRA